MGRPKKKAPQTELEKFREENLKLRIENELLKKVQLRVSPSLYVRWHYNLCKSSDYFSHLNVEKNDTIFILEDESDYSSSMITLSVWNRSDTLDYYSEDNHSSKHNGSKVKLSDGIMYTRYMMKLVSEWNIAEIKKEEISNAHSQPQDWVFATRIIINGKKYRIDCLYFKKFFDLQRDGMGFSN